MYESYIGHVMRFVKPYERNPINRTMIYFPSQTTSTAISPSISRIFSSSILHSFLFS